MNKDIRMLNFEIVFAITRMKYFSVDLYGNERYVLVMSRVKTAVLASMELAA
jgi:hypothetical protein